MPLYLEAYGLFKNPLYCVYAMHDALPSGPYKNTN